MFFFNSGRTPHKTQSISIRWNDTLKYTKYAELKKQYLDQMCLKVRSKGIIQTFVSWILIAIIRFGNTFSQRLLFGYKMLCISPLELFGNMNPEITAISAVKAITQQAECTLHEIRCPRFLYIQKSVFFRNPEVNS